MSDSQKLSEVGARIESLLDELSELADRRAHERAEELVRVLMELYGAGLERILEIAFDEGGGEGLIKRMAEDELIESLMVLHDIHPIAVEERVHEALETVRPYLGSHAGGVEYLGIDDDARVHLRLQGSCDGCQSSTVTVKLAIERAILEAAPEISGVYVEGLTEPEPPVAGLLQIESLGGPRQDSNGQHVHAPAGEWTSIAELGKLGPGDMRPVEVGGSPVLFCSVNGDILAYRNRCASCGSGLESGSLLGERLTCPACDRTYDVRLAGRSADGAPLHLDPLPLISDESGIKIAVPARAGP